MSIPLALSGKNRGIAQGKFRKTDFLPEKLCCLLIAFWKERCYNTGKKEVTTMEGFTIGLALVDAIPVLSFGISMVIIASRFQSPVFMIGAALSVLAGCCKVAWKMVLGIAKKDLRWLNKPFVPMQATGFMLMLISFIIGFGKISWSGVLAGITSLPSLLFFIAWIGLMFFMGWYRKNKFSNDDAHSNWTAQIINAIGQTCLLLGILFA
jgi:hypothetical protein